NDKKHIMHIWRSGEVEKAPEIPQKLQEETGRDFSHDTILRVLKEAGLKVGCKKKKPRLLPHQKKVHRDWVYTHKNWSTADWECVIWSDETIIERLGSHRRKWVWRRPGDSLTDWDIEGKVKHRGGSIMIWGCLTSQGIGYIC